MEQPKLQFDEHLGGEQGLPQDIKIMKFVTARSQEIVALSEAIDDPQRTGLVFQRIPKHMRRRIMSHNVKRLPKKLRDAHQNQLEKCGASIERSKRPSRKYRRRPSNLLQEYNRRQKLYVWLETHIWHAKRFHMVEKWGYKIPNFPNDKSFRACYRATSSHCFIQDISFYICIELHGLEQDILTGLKALTSPDCGLTFSAKYTLSGIREGKLILFKTGMYPLGVIGSVTFIWRPEVIGNERTLWIWTHPAYYSEVLQEMIKVFSLEINENETPMEVDSGLRTDRVDKVRNIEMEKLQNRNVPFTTAPKYKSRKMNVKMVLLENTLNRFRLIGPLSQAVLTEAFHLADINKLSEMKNNRSEMNNKTNRCDWVLDLYSSKQMFKCYKEQQKFWQEMKYVTSPNQLPAHIILPLTIVDPRLHMPNQRNKAVIEVDENETQNKLDVPHTLSEGNPIWECTWRDKSTINKLSTAELNTLRSQSLVPGLSNDEVARCGATKVSYLPVMLVQRPGVQSSDKRRGYGCGWDVILPAGWAMPVWLSLIFRGARAGGLRETDHITIEMCTEPVLPPDSSAGQSEEFTRKTDELNKYFRLPPNKRSNFIKLGIAAPFHCPWSLLLQDWSNNTTVQTSTYYVLRNRQKLQFLSSILNTKKGHIITESLNRINEFFTVDDRTSSLLPVSVKLCGRGTLSKCALICVPTKSDLKLYNKDKRYRGPVEHSHEDVNESLRKELRSRHLAKLKKLKKKRAKLKKEMEENDELFSKKDKKKQRPTEEIVSEQFEKMKNLWLPSEIQNIKESSSRNVMGFVTNGAFTFTEAGLYGQGFVASSAVLQYLKQFVDSNNVVLIRVVDSSQYSFAKLQVSVP